MTAPAGQITARLCQQTLNPLLAVEGILLTMFDGRVNLAGQVAAEAELLCTLRTIQADA